MRCKYCPAFYSSQTPESYDVDEYCNLGEEEIEFANGDTGCNRRSIYKIEKDCKRQREIESKAFAEECGRFIEFIEEENII